MNLKAEEKRLNPNPVDLGLHFVESRLHMWVPYIGEIFYDKANISLKHKILNINRGSQIIKLVIPRCIITNKCFNKNVSILTRNRIFFMYEKVLDSTKVTVLSIVYLDGTIPYNYEFSTKGKFVKYTLDHDRIVLLYTLTKNKFFPHFLIKYFDSKLNLLDTIDINYHVSRVIITIF
jgi:hypothetical protein